MTLDTLIRILGAIPREYRGMTVFKDDGAGCREVTVVTIDPAGTLYYDQSGVFLQSRVWRGADGQKLYETVPVPVPAPVVDLPDAPPID